jgi:integrase
MGKRGQGEGTIRKRTDGRWEAMITVPQEDGSTKRHSIYGKSQAEVRRKLTEARRTLDQGDTLITDRQTVAQFLNKWLTDVARATLRSSTYVSYHSKINLHIIPALGKHQLAKLTPQQVQAMMNGMIERGLSPRSAQYARAVLRRALNQALKWGLVTKNAAALTDPPRTVRPETQILTPEQARRFLDVVRGDRLEALYAVALSLGLRQGEALALRWQDIDLDAGSLRVVATLQKLPNRPYELVEPKTRQSRRTLPLTPTLAAQLRAHRTRQIAERLRAGSKWQGDEWGLVFTTESGGPLAKATIFQQYRRHLTRAELPILRFHDLRHPRVVMEILGHSTITLTMNTYAHVLPAAQRDAAALLEGVFAEALGNAS